MEQPQRTDPRSTAPQWQILVAVLIVASLVGVYVLDLVTGLVPDLTVLYLGPIVAAEYVFGIWGGVLAALGALVGVALAHPSHGTALATDVVAHFGVFLFAIVVVDRLRRQLIEIRALEERRDFDLGIAREVQSELLRPAPADPRFEIACVLQFARQVGGDFYRFEEMRDGLFVCVADISGKGLAAALFATVLAQTVDEMLGSHDDLAETMAALNRRLYQTMPSEMFVTMFSAVLHDDSFTFANAGHVPPLVHSPASGVAEIDVDGTPPLGVLPEIDVRTERRSLASGESLLVCTDGITESPPFMHDPALLPRLFAETAEGGPQRVVSVISDAALAEGVQKDDVTIVCVRRR